MQEEISDLIKKESNPAEKSLLELHHISDREIAARKKLLYFTNADVVALKKLKAHAKTNLDVIVDKFYDKQLQSREVSLLIGDSDTLRRLRSAMRLYILELFDGVYDADYVNKRLRIGKVHQRIGVSPKLYVSALNLLLSTMVEVLFEGDDEEQDIEPSIEQRRSLRKLMMFDMQLVFDTYISSLVAEVTMAREELEDYAEGLEEVVAERTEQLKQISIQDSLTGLYNQRGFYEHLQRELTIAERNGESVSFIYFDLNQFKAVNDDFGHSEGNQVLEMIGKSMLACIREVDYGCRYGGDEFAVILPRAGLDQAKAVLDRFIEAFDGDKRHDVTISAGIICNDTVQPESIDGFVSRADKLMYKAKVLARKKPGHYIEMIATSR